MAAFFFWSGHMQHELPDLPDMQRASLGITEALAYWSEMMNSPDSWSEMRL